MTPFDYNVEAELFPTRNWKSARRPMRYRRFPTTAEAVRFAMEELPPEHLLGAFLQVEDERFNGDGIRQLYESKDYPLVRAVSAL